MKIVVSGGFDPLHVGHLRMFKEASQYADLVVYLNNDSWLERKKGKYFMAEEDRAEIIESLECVTEVIIQDDDEDDMSLMLEKHMPDIFANGGDRTELNTPEKDVCERLGIEMLYNIGGVKARSSSELLDKYNNVNSVWSIY